MSNFMDSQEGLKILALLQNCYVPRSTRNGLKISADLGIVSAKSPLIFMVSS